MPPKPKKSKNQENQEIHTTKNDKTNYEKVYECESAIFCFLDEAVTNDQLDNKLLYMYVCDQLKEKILKQHEISEIKLFGRNIQVKFDLPNNEKNQIDPEAGYLITKTTKISLNTVIIQKDDNKKIEIINKSQEIIIEFESKACIELSKLFSYQELLKNDISDIPLKIKGVVLIGPPSSGKTFICKRLINTFANISVLNISMHKFMRLEPADVIDKFDTIFNKILKEKIDIVVQDDMNFKSDDIDKANFTVVTAIEVLFKRITNCLVLGVTNSQENIPKSQQKINLFEKYIHQENPTSSARFTIVSELILINNQNKDINFELSQDEITNLSQKMSGFSVTDIIRLFKEAQMYTRLESLDKIDFNVLRKSLSDVQPSQLGEIIAEMPKVYWNDIGGYLDVKKSVKNVVELPLLKPEIFKKKGITPSKGILFYGPPGCSKTLMAKAIATEGYFNFLSVKGPEIFSKYVGDSEKAIRDIFRKAKLSAPCVIFFDEIDAIASKRGKSTDVTDRVLIQLLTEMDGFEGLKDILILAATNRPDALDSALIRPGRFDELIHISLPDLEARQQIVNISTKGMPIDEDVKLDDLAKKTDGYTGAEIVNICRESGLNSIRRDVESDTVTWEDFETSLNKLKPRVNAEMIAKYQSFETNKKSLFG